MEKDYGKILVVDDEERMCESLKTLLSKVGYEVTTVQEGEKAIEKIKQDDFDLVISDIKMPTCDGLDILKAVRTKDQNALVILMTGFASLESAVNAINQGAYDYLMKPFEFPDLKLTIKRGLEKRRSDQARNRLLAELKEKNLELNKRVAELDALYQASKSLSSTEHLDILLDKIVSLATSVIGAKMGSIMLIQEPKNILTIKSAIGLEPEIIEHTKLELGKSIAGYVAQKGAPLIIEDIENDQKFKRLSKKHYATKSLLCVPLKIKEKVLGVINLSDKVTGAPFNQDDLRLLTTFASQAAIAIDDAHHFEQTKKKIEELSILYEIASTLSTLESFEKISDFIFERVKRIMGVDFALWFGWSEKEKQLSLDFCQGLENKRTDSKNASHFQISLEKQEILDSDKLNAKIKEKLKENFNLSPYLDSVASFPIIAEGMLHGVLSVGNREHRTISEEEKHLISIIASQSASVYERQKSILNATRLLTMGSMVSEITHDLKKPLTNIKGVLQLLKEKWSDTDAKEKFFDMVEQEIFRLNELAKEIVNFSNPHKYELEKKDIRHTLDRALNLVKPDLDTRKIALKIDYQEVPHVFINENEIMEVLLNIILNAIEAMPEGGELGVSLRPDQKSKNGAQILQIGIADTGCGIAPENLSRIFDRYFTTKKEGTGLGLTVVERIVKAHGGFVSVKSEPGKGTSFFVNLPAEELRVES
jgi:signal transduction histidine kinase/DNA-binding response OmpR family regulator/putative methionine-R-sulfoxide reductase with GAF domain